MSLRTVLVVAAAAATLVLGSERALAAGSYAAWSGYTPLTVRGGSELISCDTCSAEARDTNGDGFVDWIAVTLDPPGDSERVFTFGTARTGRPLGLGLYTRATYDELPGRPLMRFANYDICSSGEQGAFEVLRAEFDTRDATPRVVSFLARFEVQCPGEPYPFKGVVSFEAPDVPQLAAVEYSTATRTLRAYGERIESATMLVVDASPVKFKVDPKGGLLAKRLRLGAGAHEVRVAGPASVSPPFALAVDDDPPFAKSSFKATSDPGEFIGRGETWRSGKAPVSFRMALGGESGLPETIALGYSESDVSSIGVEFSTAKLGRPFAAGFYPNAMRIPFEDPGHPGMDASSSGRGCNTVAGQFTVTDYAVDALHGLPRVRWVAVDFEHFCEGGPLGLRGSVRYVAPDPVVIIASSYSAPDRTLRVRATGLAPGAELYVDGQRLGPTSLERDALVLHNVDLGPGLHLLAIYVAEPTRYEYSQPWVFTL